MRFVIGICLAVAAASGAAGALATGVLTIVQQQRAFSVQTASVPRNRAIVFANEDLFVHQIYVSSPAFNFESDEQPPGTTVDVTFPAAGTFEVRCRIHPKMLVTVDVR